MSGFTLMEALIAITILAIGLIAIVTMIDVGFSAGNLSRNTTRATELATWMMERIKQETWNVEQTYTSDLERIKTFDNDATTDIAVSTENPGNPASEPGATAVKQWRALIQGDAIDKYLGAGTLAGGTKLPGGYGEVLIIPNDPNHGNHHFVRVSVIWPTGILKHQVVIDSLLASSK
jgi:Tfp pilus assembly protein PilV